MNKKNILILIVTLMVFSFAGFYLFKNNNTDKMLVADSGPANSDEAQVIYNLLQKMAKVKLDDSIFSNNNFKGLKDNSVEIIPQETGRSNPFAPVNFIDSRSSIATSSTKK
jgi:hypothetical protein